MEKENGKMNFEEYKIKATKDDVEKLEKKIKIFWWENIPVIGCIIYIIRMGVNQQDIDRGILRKQIVIYNLIFTFALLFYIHLLLSLITPWYTNAIYKEAIKKTKEKIKERDL